MPATDPSRDVSPDVGAARTVRRSQEPLWREVLGEQLRALRHARGETLAETARHAGVSPQYLSEVERGRKEPSSEMIAALAGALGTTLGDLAAGVAERLRARETVPAGPPRLVPQPGQDRTPLRAVKASPAAGAARADRSTAASTTITASLAITAARRAGLLARGRSRRRGGHPVAACRSSMTWSMSPYSLAVSAVKTRSWSVSARSRSMVWFVCRERMRSISARTRTTSSA